MVDVQSAGLLFLFQTKCHAVFCSAVKSHHVDCALAVSCLGIAVASVLPSLDFISLSTHTLSPSLTLSLTLSLIHL